MKEDDEEIDIVETLSQATGYFHDSEAAKLLDIVEHDGQKPVGLVRTAVEKEIERREWQCVHFEHSDDDKYPSRDPYEYYRIHKSLQLEYEQALEFLPKETNGGYECHALEIAADTLQDKAREHKTKARQAELYLEENDLEVPTVEKPYIQEEKQYTASELRHE